MKLLTYDTDTGPRAGVLDGSDVLDAAALLGSSSALRDVRAVLESSPDALDRLREALVARPDAQRVPLATVKLRAPILQPPTVPDHIAFEEHATGDVIATGTVGGGSISEAVRKGYPARWLQPGDTVEIEVEGIGTLRNTLAPPCAVQQPLRFTAPTARPLPDPLSADELQGVRERTAPLRL